MEALDRTALACTAPDPAAPVLAARDPARDLVAPVLVRDLVARNLESDDGAWPPALIVPLPPLGPSPPLVPLPSVDVAPTSSLTTGCAWVCGEACIAP
ncbi:MAG: hypothetical protein ACTH8J_10725 [Specibacter sp.]